MLHFLYVWLGLSNGSGAQYLFWSGIFGDVTIFSSITYGLYQLRKRTQCHEPTCHKHGKYEFHDKINQVTYKLCADHHPGVPVNGPSHLHLTQIHKKQKDQNYEY